VTLKSLSESSPVTIGVAAAVLVCGFWAGLEIGALRTTDVGQGQSIAKLDENMTKISDMLLNHETRLAAIEAREGHKP
jgi:hypothetical protein